MNNEGSSNIGGHMEAMGIGIMLLVGLLQMVIFGLSIASFVIMIMAIIDITKRPDTWKDKMMWLILVILVPFCNLIYWFSIRKQINLAYPIAPQGPPTQTPTPPAAGQ